MTDPLDAQYADSTQLKQRANLHARYGKAPWFSWLVDHMALPRGGHIIDIGCGPGWVWRRTAAQAEGWHLTLVDRSAGMVAEATAALVQEPTFAEVDGCTADAGDVPRPDASAHAVVLMHVLYHLDDPARAIDEAVRLLRPGGRVFVTVNAADNLASINAPCRDIFGSVAEDHLQSPVFLDTAEDLLADAFTDVSRHDQVETYRITDPGDVLAFLLSMPPAQDATPEAKAALAAHIDATFQAAGGTLETTKRTGLVIGTKPVA